MEITLEDLRKMQLLQLSIFKEFDLICRKNGIKYTLCGGSLLGAIRHGGFIPWDDDIDVTMLRADYEKFSMLCKNELDNERFFFQTMETDEEYRLMYGKIILKGTSFVRTGYEKSKAKNGIFIDIFPRDNVSDNMIKRSLQSILGFLMRKTLYSPIGKIKAELNLFYRVVYSFLAVLPLSFPKKLMRWIIVLGGNKPTERVACYGLMGNKEKKKKEKGKKGYAEYIKKLRFESEQEKVERKDREKGFYRKFFEEVHDVKFEDMTAMITDFYDFWLKVNYDNYMELPPKEKRTIHQTVSFFSLGEISEN